jgi:hypothetical protein
MSEARLTGVLMSIVLLGLIVTGLSIFITGVASKYGADRSDLNESFMQSFVDESQATTARMEDASDNLLAIKEDKNLLDRLASYFKGGYDAALSLRDSIKSTTRLINLSIGQVRFLGSFGSTLAVYMGILTLIIIFGIFMHFLIKSERI